MRKIRFYFWITDRGDVICDLDSGERGIALLSPTDSFNPRRGVAIALLRAMAARTLKTPGLSGPAEGALRAITSTSLKDVAVQRRISFARKGPAHRGAAPAGAVQAALLSAVADVAATRAAAFASDGWRGGYGGRPGLALEQSSGLLQEQIRY